MTPDINGKSIELRQTCEACPEQYDAYFGDEKVGYLRLRWGYLSVECPWVNGEEVYAADIGGEYTGQFEDEDQRKKHLKKARKAIARWLSTVGNNQLKTAPPPPGNSR